MYFEGEFCFVEEALFQPLIWMGERAPEGFNTITIPVSLTIDSSLDLAPAREKATKALESGYKIIFDLDLGLFDRLPLALESDMLFSTLSFSIALFKKELLEPFQDHTLGIIAYKGPADFYPQLKNDYSLHESFALWNDSQETTDLTLSQGYFEMGLKFIERVTESIPANFPIFVLLDFEKIENSALKAFMLNRERLGKLLLVPKNADAFYSGMKWEGRACYPYAYFGTKEMQGIEPSQKKFAILLPTLENKQLLAYKEISLAIDFFIKEDLAFRLVPESLFISEWEEIDHLFVPPQLSKEAKRAVNGFLASEGKVTVIEEGWINDWKD